MAAPYLLMYYYLLLLLLLLLLQHRVQTQYEILSSKTVLGGLVRTPVRNRRLHGNQRAGALNPAAYPSLSSSPASFISAPSQQSGVA